MSKSERMMEAGKLRLRLQMSPRLRLELLASMARVFREYGDPISDELLSTVILAVPEELLGEAPAGGSNGEHGYWGAKNPVPSPADEPLNPVPSTPIPKVPPVPVPSIGPKEPEKIPPTPVPFFGPKEPEEIPPTPVPVVQPPQPEKKPRASKKRLRPRSKAKPRTRV
jgi:hypothetical protein